jgi:CheY-like chemotaxis protein
MFSEGSTQSAVVLVVEDEPLLRMAAVSFLEDAEFEVIEAADADEALKFLESRNDIRLIFTDIDMPYGSMNGLRLARAVRDRWPPVEIIIVSGHQVPDTMEMPERSRFFAKPYNEAQMVSTMREMLQAA